MAIRKTKAKKKVTKRRTTKAVAKRSEFALSPELLSEFEDSISQDRATVVAATGWPIIRTSSAGFTLGGEALPDLLPLIVLGGIRQNVLFEGAYDPSSPQLPTCAAVDTEGDESTMAPPSGGKAEACRVCDFNAWGSGAGRGKACKNQLKLAVFPWYDDTDYTTGGRGAVLNLSPTALKPWAEYAEKIVAQGRPLFSVITNFEVKALPQGFSVAPSFGGLIKESTILRALHGRAQDDARKTLIQLPPIQELDPSAEPTKPAQKGGVRRKKIQR